MLSLLLLVFVTADVLCERPKLIIPEATLEFMSPKGLKISVPDWDPDVTLVAFHVNLNEEFLGVEHGQWAADVNKPRRGQWSYLIPELRAQQGDTIYYWVYAIKDGVGYQDLDRNYNVLRIDPHHTFAHTRPPYTTTDKASTTGPVAVDWRIDNS